MEFYKTQNSPYFDAVFHRLYDCDFNQQLELGLPHPQHRTVFDIDSLAELTGKGHWHLLSLVAAATG